MNARVELQPLASLLAAAAGILTGQTAAEGPPLDLLARLDYRGGTGDVVSHRAALLRAAAGFHRIFSLPAQDAPGLIVLGAEVDPAALGVENAAIGGVSGTGLTFRQAFESCVGEGIEFISGFARPDDQLMSLTADEALAGASPALRDMWDRLLPFRRNPNATRTDWIAAADLADGHPVYLPADICLRRPAEARDIETPWPLSTGCGAGPDPLDATLHGLLELIERDAVALWWRGGVRGRLLPPGVGSDRLARLRGGTTKRRTWLLDITSDAGVPVVLAAACNDGGFGLCLGHACRPTLAAAADAALTELAQMEVAYRIAAAKREVRGDAALNEADRQHIQRYTAVDVGNTAALHPLVPPAQPCDLLSLGKIAELALVRKQLTAIGLEVYALNLTRPELGVPVTRTIAPGLEAGLRAPPGPRLRSAAARTGVDPARVVSL